MHKEQGRTVESPVEARQGFRILVPRAADIADIFEVRLALELPAVRKLAGAGTGQDRLLRQRALMREAAAVGDERGFVQHDQGLHDLILELAGNARARAIVARLRETTRLLGASTAEKTRTLADSRVQSIDMSAASRPH